MNLLLLPESYAICRLGSDSVDPTWGRGANFWSLTRSADELSLVCDEASLPEDTGVAQISRGWRCLRVAGTLDFAMIGVLASLAAPIAAAGVTIFVVSTYDTDYMLLPADGLERAVAALATAGHQVG